MIINDILFYGPMVIVIFTIVWFISKFKKSIEIKKNFKTKELNLDNDSEYVEANSDKLYEIYNYYRTILLSKTMKSWSSTYMLGGIMDLKNKGNSVLYYVYVSILDLGYNNYIFNLTLYKVDKDGPITIMAYEDDSTEMIKQTKCFVHKDYVEDMDIAYSHFLEAIKDIDISNIIGNELQIF